MSYSNSDKINYRNLYKPEHVALNGLKAKHLVMQNVNKCNTIYNFHSQQRELYFQNKSHFERCIKTLEMSYKKS